MSFLVIFNIHFAYRELQIKSISQYDQFYKILYYTSNSPQLLELV